MYICTRIPDPGHSLSKLRHQPFAPQSVSLATRTLLLAIFLLPSLVPTGYMLQRNVETSLVEITICSGFNHRSAWLNVETGEYLDTASQQSVEPGTPEPQPQAQDLCPFAISAFALTGPDCCDVLSLVSYPVFELQQPAAVPVQLLHLPPSRGPPTLS